MDNQYPTPLEIKRTVSVVTEVDGKKVKVPETVVSMECSYFGIMPKVMPLLFELFPQFMKKILGGSDEEQLKEFRELIKNKEEYSKFLQGKLAEICEDKLETVIQLLMISLDKPRGWFDRISFFEGVLLMADFLIVNQHNLFLNQIGGKPKKKA